MPEAKLFKATDLPFKPCVLPSGTTQTARVVTSAFSSHMGAGFETLDNVAIEWTTLYDEVLFIHSGSILIRTDSAALEAGAGDIVWLPEGLKMVYDCAGRQCGMFYALYPIDWARRNGMEEP